MDFKSILLLTFALVSTNGEPLFQACHKDDLTCLRNATETFMSKVYNGMSNLGMIAIDPYTMSSLEVDVDDDIGLVFYFKNLSVTGLKNLKIEDFKMDTEQQSVLLKMKAELVVTSDLDVKLTKVNKVLTGLYTAAATVHETSRYGYSLKIVNGTEYFEVGPETSSCEILTDPTVTLGVDLQNTLDRDQDAISMKTEWETKKVAIRKKTLCTIANPAFSAVIHNLRASGRIFPKSYFFIDI